MSFCSAFHSGLLKENLNGACYRCHLLGETSNSFSKLRPRNTFDLVVLDRIGEIFRFRVLWINT